MRCNDRSFRRSTAALVAACLAWCTGSEGWAMARATEDLKPRPTTRAEAMAPGEAHGSLGPAGAPAAFEAVEAWARREKLPPAVLARHFGAVKSFEAAAARGEAVDSDRELVQRPLDPKRLPFRARKADPRPLGESSRVATAAGILRAAPPSAADLAETEEVRLTPEIRARAAALGNDPRRIYEWVKSEVELLPTYGATQDSAATLERLCGNPLDTATLLVALLRAAGIPARYVTGVVSADGADVRNAFGGLESTGQAEQLARAGGIAASVRSDGGADDRLQFQHAWVEAFVDYVPGRGATNGERDTWLALDASWKEHRITPPLSREGAPTLDGIVSPTDPLFMVDAPLGKVSGLDDHFLGPRIETWLQDTFAFLESQQVPGTVEGIAGGESPIAENRTILPASLPYRVEWTEARYAALPSSLRHSIVVQGFASAIDRSTGHAALSASISFPSLGSRRLGVRFVPASALDEQILTTARTSGASSLPIYLVRVTPRIEVDGVVLATGAAVPMGSPYYLDASLRSPSGTERVPFTVAAGDEIVVGAQAGEIRSSVAEKRLAAHPVADAPEFLHQASLQYFAALADVAGISARAIGARLVVQPSVGVFSAPISVSTLYGVPFSGTYQSHAMDLQLLSVDVAAPTTVLAHQAIRQTGFIASYLEGAIYARLDPPADRESGTGGLSAVSLLGAAAAQGIPLYRITQENLAAVLPHLELSATVEAEVANAVSQGSIALVPERNVDLGIWKGAGYVIEDPFTGAAGYLISGGTAGGALVRCIKELAPAWVPVHIIQFATALLAIMIATAIFLPQILEALVEAVAAFARLILMLRFLAPLGAAGLAG